VPAPRSGEAVGELGGSGTGRQDDARPHRRGGRHTAERPVPRARPLRRASARFYLYSELDAKEGVVSGYVKPLFKDLQIYSKQQDKDKSAFQLPAARRAPEALL
jgi:hypothetical protein